jgi:Arc/MetJ-type ribon-helix-helix transcriptional regulator
MSQDKTTVINFRCTPKYKRDVKRQAKRAGYSEVSEYLRALIDADQKRLKKRAKR